MMAGMESRFHGKLRRWQDYGSIDNIAAESFGLAKSQVYGKARPRLPVIPKFIEVQPRNCATEAPESLRDVKVDGPRSYGAKLRGRSAHAVVQRRRSAGRHAERDLRRLTGDFS